MTETQRCIEKELLVDFLYGEVDDDARARVETHLRGCTSCAEEVGALRDVRATLGEWAPPETELGFQLVAADTLKAVPASSWRTRLAGPWGLAAAAVLVLAAASAVANLELQFGRDGVVVRTGWGEDAAAATTTPALGPIDDAWVRSVEQMIIDSEQRQRQALDLRVQEAEQRIASQRRSDLVEMERTFREVDAEDAELARQQLLEYMRRISR